MAKNQNPDQDNKQGKIPILLALFAFLGNLLKLVILRDLSSFSSLLSPSVSLIKELSQYKKLYRFTTGLFIFFSFITSIYFISPWSNSNNQNPSITAETEKSQPDTELSKGTDPKAEYFQQEDPSITGSLTLHQIKLPGGVVTDDFLNVREGPGKQFNAFWQFRTGTPLSVISRDVTATWLRVADNEGHSGWVYAEFVHLDINILELPIDQLSVGPLPTGITTATVLNSREGPGTEFKVVGQLEMNTHLLIICRDINAVWLKVIDQKGHAGWVFSDFVQVNVDVQEIPVADTETNIYSIGIVTNGPLNIRRGPSETSKRISRLRSNASIVIISKDEHEEWVRIAISSNYSGWVSTKHIRTDIDLRVIPKESSLSLGTQLRFQSLALDNEGHNSENTSAILFLIDGVSMLTKSP